MGASAMTRIRPIPSHKRRYGSTSRIGTSKYLTAQGEVDTSLIYPVTETTDTSTDPGLKITIGEQVSIAHHGFELRNAAGTLLFAVPPDGGPSAQPGYPWRVYNAKSDTNYGAFFAPSDTMAAYIEVPDAGSGSGRMKIFGGVGAPSASTIGGTVAVGDIYWRKRASGSTQVLYYCTAAGNPGTWTQII